MAKWSALEKKMQIRKWRSTVEGHMLKGLTDPVVIANAVGVSVNAAKRLMKSVYAAWASREDAADEEKRIVRVKQLENIVHKAMTEYEESKEPDPVDPDDTCPDGSPRTEPRKKKGDLMALGLARATLIDIAKVEGSIAPAKTANAKMTLVQEMTGPNGEKLTITSEEMKTIPTEDLTKARLAMSKVLAGLKDAQFPKIPENSRNLETPPNYIKVEESHSSQTPDEEEGPENVP